MAVEAELKLGMPEGLGERVLSHSLVTALAQGGPRTRQLSNTYYDTPELTLLASGVGLRLRRSGERWLQTVKTSGTASGGLHQRQEWEMEVAGPALELDRLDAPELAPLFGDPALRAALQPLFTTEFTRTTLDLAGADGTRMELAVDQGEVRTLRGSSPISELELELCEGGVSGLFDLAIGLTRDLPLTLEQRSKAARGYAFFQPPAPPSLPAPPPLGADQPLHSAYGALLQWGVDGLQAAETALLAAATPDALRQLRTAVEALEALLALFGGLLPDGENLLGEMACLTRRLAPLRYWDALVTEGLDAVARNVPEAPGLAQALRRGRELRDQRAEDLRDVLLSQRYTRLLLGLGKRLACPAWGEEPNASERFGPSAGTALVETEAGLRRRGRELRDLSPAAQRTLRQAASLVWHGARWLAPSDSGSGPWQAVAALGRLHHGLEAFHDCSRAAELVEELGETLDEPLRALVETELRLRRRELRAEAQAAWERQRDEPRFWRAAGEE